MSKQVYFIGPLGAVNRMIGGDSYKNLHLTRRLESLKVNLRIIDTIECKKSLFKMAYAVLLILFHRRGKFIVSASSVGAYKLLKLMKWLGVTDVIYWVVGGDFPHLLNCEMVSPKPYANAKTIIVEGKRMEESLRICGLRNVITLPNFKAIEYVPEKKRVKVEPPIRFVFLSRIAEDKGCSYINRAAAMLNARGLSASYSIDYYGSIADIYKEQFMSEIGELPNVEYKGFLKLVEISNYDVLAGYDVMLFPTFFYGEGFAGIFIDALIAGLPVVATDWNLNSEIVRHGETGVVVENRNAERLADAMEMLIREPQKIEAMSKRCQSECMKYDVANLVTPALVKQLGLLE